MGRVVFVQQRSPSLECNEWRNNGATRAPPWICMRWFKSTTSINNINNNMQAREEALQRKAALAYDQAAFLTRGVLATLNFSAQVTMDSLQEMGFKALKSDRAPLLELKRMHVMRTKYRAGGSGNNRRVKRTCNDAKFETTKNVLVLEDLGPEYLDQLLSFTSPGSWC
ncbi:hypothetical protein Fmac_030007 [Flemingia macrophylla]|uniref:Uncharacterized protein n=1 Tax=Flemingia macrophylla TaxID=520843 RepID=A0ABD1LC79_9FABA